MNEAPPFGLVVMAASAGGVQALQQVLSSLPADFPAPICVVQHRSLHTPDLLPGVLGRSTRLKVKRSQPGERMEPGTVYLAPIDAHLLVNPDRTLAMTDGTRIRHVLSSANPLFISAAQATGKGTIGVVLTGNDGDATDGVQAIKQEGGLVIAQDRATSQNFGMPGSAIRTGAVDYILPLNLIGPALVDLVHGRSLTTPRFVPTD
jgi:two-component system, chemotaxis family, protein-glutamate methylesterase/glutaminase